MSKNVLFRQKITLLGFTAALGPDARLLGPSTSDTAWRGSLGPPHGPPDGLSIRCRAAPALSSERG